MELSSEQSVALSRALDFGIPFLQFGGPDAALALVHAGFTTEDPWLRSGDEDQSVFERRFRRGKEQIVLLRHQEADDVRYMLSQGRNLAASYGCRVVYQTFSTPLRRVYLAAPWALDPIGPTAAVVNLCELRQ